jgi:hypothetical protein
MTVWEVTSAARSSQDKEESTCFLYRESFINVNALTGHCKSLHVEKGTFDRSFPCPECRRRGNPDDHLITSLSSWSGHVEMFHGYYSAPKFRTDPQPVTYETKICCPYCGLYIRPGVGFNVYRSSHVRDGAASTIFSSPFPCLACRNEQGSDGKQDVLIDGCSAWDEHVLISHADAEGNWFVEGPPEPPGPPMRNETPVCLLCDDRCPFDSQKALTMHFKTVHVKNGKRFDKTFPCPECRRCGKPDQSITSISSWNRHVAMVHGRENMPKLRTVPQPSLDKIKQDADLSLAYIRTTSGIT